MPIVAESARSYTPYRKIERPGSYKLVNVSDLHVPYHLERGLDTVYEYAKTCDGIVINGDVLDCSNASRFPVYEVDSVFHSYSQAVEIMAKLKDLYNDVFVVAGNHDLRYERMLRKNRIFAEFVEVFGGCDILEKACIEAGVLYSRNGFKINDVIFFHPDNYLSSTLGTARKTVEHMLQYNDNFKAVSIGHTHQLAYGYHMGKLMFESGKLCARMPSERMSHNLNLKHTTPGFIVFDFSDMVLTSFTFVEVGG